MLEKPFTNAGDKIKRYAKAMFVVESIAAIIGGFVIMIEDEDMFFICLLVAIAGIALAYIMSLFMAAFGELVQSSAENKQINQKILEKLSESSENG